MRLNKHQFPLSCQDGQSNTHHVYGFSRDLTGRVTWRWCHVQHDVSPQSQSRSHSVARACKHKSTQIHTFTHSRSHAFADKLPHSRSITRTLIHCGTLTCTVMNHHAHSCTIAHAVPAVYIYPHTLGNHSTSQTAPEPPARHSHVNVHGLGREQRCRHRPRHSQRHISTQGRGGEERREREKEREREKDSHRHTE